MRRLATLTLISLAGCAPKVEQQSFRLDNGLEVELLGTTRGEKAGVALVFRVGADHDPPGRSGLSQLAARTYAGDGFEARAGRDYTAVTAALPAAALLEALDRLAARLASLEPTEADLGRARAEALESLARMRGKDPGAAAESFAAEAVATSRGDGWRGGVQRELEAVAIDELAAFVKAHLKAGNARLAVAGKLDPAAARARIEAAFGKAATGAPPVQRPPATSRVSGTLVMGDSPRVAALAVAAPAPGHADYPGFLLLAGRLARGGAGWASKWDPLGEPEVLLVSAALEPNERPDDAGARLRKAVGATVQPAPSAQDVEHARQVFSLALGLGPVTVAQLEAAPALVAWSRARAPQLGLDGKALAPALVQVTAPQLEAAAARFGEKATAVVVAGGELR